MRPPAPAATLRFGSPNACNGCHGDRTPAWADRWVRTWHPRDFQAPLLRRGELIAAARARDWKRLPEMLEAVTGRDRDEVVANSLIRLLRACDDERVEPALLAAIKDPSPLIRSSAAESLGMLPSPEGIEALMAAAGDDYRLVRIRAAKPLAELPLPATDDSRRSAVEKATEEYLASIMARPDQWTSHYNLGNYHLGRGEYASAVEEYETAIRLDPQEVTPLVNLSIAYARRGDNAEAKKALDRALLLEPANAEANFNLGLLEAETQDRPRAEEHLRRALETDPQMAPAAYNLCVLLAESRPGEALELCRRAAALRPREPRYAWTEAYYLARRGDARGAEAVLEDLLRRQPGFADATLLLAEVLAKKGERDPARQVYERALRSGALSPEDRSRIEQALLTLRGRQPGSAE